MKLIVAHRQRLVREALRRSLARGRYELVAQADDLESLRRDNERLAPQLLLVELELMGQRAERLPELLRNGASVIALAPDSAAAGAYEAMGHGALGLIEPPLIDDDGELIGAQRVLDRLDRLAGLVRAPRKSGTARAQAAAAHVPILAIGASTGGPQALAKVLAALPEDFAACVLIVQHIEDGFSSGLAEWLAGQCRLPVRLAERGAVPEAGHVYLGSPGAHLVLSSTLRFAQQAARAGELHVPGIDVLFQSLARHVHPGAAVILTGMGSDGAAGLGDLQRKGWLTLAQDEASCVVYGMPRAAVESGAARRSLALDAIGPALVRHFRRPAR